MRANHGLAVFAEDGDAATEIANHEFLAVGSERGGIDGVRPVHRTRTLAAQGIEEQAPAVAGTGQAAASGIESQGINGLAETPFAQHGVGAQIEKLHLRGGATQGKDAGFAARAQRQPCAGRRYR